MKGRWVAAVAENRPPAGVSLGRWRRRCAARADGLGTFWARYYRAQAIHHNHHVDEAKLGSRLGSDQGRGDVRHPHEKRGHGHSAHAMDRTLWVLGDGDPGIAQAQARTPVVGGEVGDEEALRHIDEAASWTGSLILVLRWMVFPAPTAAASQAACSFALTL